MSLRVTRTGLLEVERPGRPCETVALAADVSWPTPVVGCASASGASALLGLVRHDLMFWVAAAGGAPRRCPLGERIPNAEQLAIVALASGFGVIYENGLATIGDDGHERWRIHRVTFDWRFVGERDGALWLSDAGGNLLGFDASTGLERS